MRGQREWGERTGKREEYTEEGGGDAIVSK